MFTPNVRNQYDRKDCLELGKRAEDLFARLAADQGWKIKPASGTENKDDHFDYRIARDHQVYKVEVKGKKRIRRVDTNTQGDLIWIELHGVRFHDAGWLFGRADLIAFETNTSFRIVRRLDLVALVHKLVDFTSKVFSPGDALYKIYSRSERHDLLTLLRDEDLNEILWAEWKYPTLEKG